MPSLFGSSGQWASRSLHNSSGRGGPFASPCSFKQPMPHTNLFCSLPCLTSLLSLFGLSRPSLYPSSFHNEAGSGTFPHSLTFEISFFPVTWAALYPRSLPASLLRVRAFSLSILSGSPSLGAPGGQAFQNLISFQHCSPPEEEGRSLLRMNGR